MCSIFSLTLSLSISLSTYMIYIYKIPVSNDKSLFAETKNETKLRNDKLLQKPFVVRIF